MTTSDAQTPAPAAPGPASPPPEPSATPSQLEYATPWPRRVWLPSALEDRRFWQGVRKIVLAGGLGLLAYAVASVAGGVNRHVAPVAAAWGILFVALALPAPYLGRKRRKRKPRGEGAAIDETSGI